VAREGETQPPCSAAATMHYMTTPLSIRFDPSILERLRRRAGALPGATPSGLAQRLVDEGLRQAEHTGVVFKDGPAGRRAALALGPDIAEVIRVLKEVDERGPAAVDAAAEILHLTNARLRVAMGYYGAHADEIDGEIADGDEASLAAEMAWRAEQRLLA
jgi:hypothetical protein